jgi:hypothetical protein
MIKFKGSIIEWRGPSPFYFVPIPGPSSKKVKSIAAQLTYGWGVIPVLVKIRDSSFTTSLIPRGDVYYLPIKYAVRFAENLEVGSEASVAISFGS